MTILIDGQDYTAHVPLPIKWNDLLDERLDESVMSVHSVPMDIFPIGAEVSIEAGEISLGFIIAADEAKEIPAGSGKYDHDLTLIEATKSLEGVVLETLTSTNALGRYYTDTPVKVEPVYD